MVSAKPGTQRLPIRFRALEKVKVRPPSLIEICLKRVAQNFLRYDNLSQHLGKKQLEDVYALLDLDIPLPEAATRINDENYWKRRTQQNHRNSQVEKHGMSWKQTYLELELQNALERVTIDYGLNELEELKQQVLASRLYIYQLKIEQFPSHIDLSFIFDALPALCTFSITYGNKRLGMDYERAMFGMKISDGQYLARNLRVSQTLVSLALPCNMIDDELVKVLMSGLSYAHMLTSLDLSHNKIGDRGARRLASLMDPKYCIQNMDLSDNQIHANGCMHLGAHLAENMTVQKLNLRLNRCEDNGVSHLFQDMCVNKYLKTLNVSCNDLTTRCLAYMSSMIAENSTLTEMDLSANPLYTPIDMDDGRIYNEGENAANPEQNATAPEEDPDSPFGIFMQYIEKNQSIIKIDVRQCGLPPNLESKITTMVKHRELTSKGIPVEAYEKKRTKEEEVKEGEGEEGEEGAEGEEGEGGEGAEGEGENGEETKEEEDE